MVKEKKVKKRLFRGGRRRQMQIQGGLITNYVDPHEMMLPSNLRLVISDGKCVSN